MRRRAATTLSALLVLAAAACERPPAPTAASGAGQAVYGGRFVFPLRIEPRTLNFATVSDQFGALVAGMIGDSLVDHDARLDVVPRLARSWEFSEDARTLTFHLRPGVRFHDGAPCTSADVVFTFDRIMDPRNRALGWIDGLVPVERIETPDPLTVRVVYRYPYAPAVHAWEFPILPRHLYEKAPDFLEAPLNRAPVGTGPFRFVSWDAGRRIVLRANDDYWAGRPYLDSFVFEVIPSQETILQALLAGEIDYATLTPLQWETRRADPGFGRRFATLRFETLFLYYIAWRTDGSNPFFGDPAVRRALSAALDREGYVRSVLRGAGAVASSLFHPAVAAADPELGPLSHDPDEASALLDRAGWRRSGGGERRRGGVPFRFTLLIYGAGEDHVLFAQVAQESLRRIGVDMRIERLDWPTLATRLREGRFQAAMSGVVPGIDPDGVFGMLHSSQVAGGQNYAAFRDPEVDAWLEEGRRTLDPARRAGIYHRIDRRLREAQPYAPLFLPVQIAAYARDVQNIAPSPLGILDHALAPARLSVPVDRP